MPHDPEDIEAWLRLDARTTTSGFLTERDVKRLAEIGVRHVINLAPDEHPGALAGEADLLAASGIRYSHIPVPFDAPDDSHFDAFCAAFEADDEPVHVHCIANFRVSAFFYRYNRDLRGMAEPQARALMEQLWAPDKSDQPAMRVWADFIARGDD